MGMTDSRVDVIVVNAFDGLGDMTGDNEFGLSVAWINLDDHLDTMGLDMPDECRNNDEALSAWLKTHPPVDGNRWVLAYLDCNGFRDVQGFPSKNDMRKAFQSFENEYLEWLDVDADDA